MKSYFLPLLMVFILSACSETSDKASQEKTKQAEIAKDNASYTLVMASEVDWTYLNPARADKAPMAGTLWGDRNGTEPTGFLLKPSDGFESPPHIHNVSYRGIVIDGFIHNDDPNAENMWMPGVSFWTQPKGEVHITSAKGKNTLAYVEIEEGPYLVHPEEDAFHTDERPVNIDKSNIVWLGPSDMEWIKQKTKNSSSSPEIAFLWGQTQKQELNGSLLKLPIGFKGQILSDASSFGAVVIKGQPQYQNSQLEKGKTLEKGSYFGSKGSAIHKISLSHNEEVILYIRTKGSYEIIEKE